MNFCTKNTKTDGTCSDSCKRMATTPREHFHGCKVHDKQTVIWAAPATVYLSYVFTLHEYSHAGFVNSKDSIWHMMLNEPVRMYSNVVCQYVDNIAGFLIKRVQNVCVLPHCCWAYSCQGLA